MGGVLAFFDTLEAKNTVNTFIFCASEAQNRGIYSVFVPVPSKNTGIYAVFTAKRTNTVYFTMFLLPERSRKIVKKRLKNGPKSSPTSIL